MSSVIFWSSELCQQYLAKLDNLTLAMEDVSKDKTIYKVYFPGSSGGVEIGEGEYERLFELIYGN